MLFKEIIAIYTDNEKHENPTNTNYKVKSQSCPTTRHRRLGKRRYRSYSFSTSALDRCEWSASRPGRALDPGKGPPGNHRTGCWVGLRAGLDTEATRKIFFSLSEIEPRSPGRPARSQILYWLSYPGSQNYRVTDYYSRWRHIFITRL
jgi:hypothetical protein